VTAAAGNPTAANNAGNLSRIDTGAALGTMYSVTMSVTDWSDLTVSKTFNLTLTDTLQPVVEAVLYNAADVVDAETNDTATMVAVGSEYTEVGATATDNYDGDLTPIVVVSGDTVDTAVLGAVFVVRYAATDTSGNIGTRTRTVTVVSKAELAASTGGKMPSALGTTALIGIIVGTVVLVLLVVIVVVVQRRRRHGPPKAMSQTVLGFDNTFSYINPMYTQMAESDDWFHGAIPRSIAELRMQDHGASRPCVKLDACCPQRDFIPAVLLCWLLL